MLARVKTTLFLSVFLLAGCGGSDDTPATTTTEDSGDFADVITTRPDDGVDTTVADTGTAMETSGETSTTDAPAETTADAPLDGPDAAGGVTVVTATATNTFNPVNVTVKVGQKVRWVVAGGSHSVVSGTTCVPDNKFCNPSDTSCATAPIMSAGAMYEHTFTTAGEFPYFCGPHCALGMTGKVTVTP
jgi:plastocyanin